jgi:hypothetical protein
MRLREFIHENVERGDFYYHGTSSVFLPGIMKQGLVANPQRKVYDQKHGLESYPGVYLAGTEETAIYASEVAVDKFGGEQVLICVLFDAELATADEDEIWATLDLVFTWEFKHTLKGDPIKIAKAYLTNSNGMRDKVFAITMKNLEHSFGKVDPTLVTPVLDAAMQTFATEKYQAHDITNMGMGTIVDVVGRGFRDHMLALMNSIKASSYTEDESLTVRYPDNIGFEGFPRILWITQNGRAVYGDPPPNQLFDG